MISAELTLLIEFIFSIISSLSRFSSLEKDIFKEFNPKATGSFFIIKFFPCSFIIIFSAFFCISSRLVSGALGIIFMVIKAVPIYFRQNFVFKCL